MMTNKDIELQVSWLVWFIGVQWASSALLTGLASAQTIVTLTSSVEQAGRQAACPGEEVTFTCTVTNEPGLGWIAEPFIPQNNPLDFTSVSDVGSMQVDNSGNFIAVLTSVTQSGAFADFTSELAVTATETLNETVVQCSAITSDLNKTFIIAAPPSRPQQLEYSVLQYHVNNFTVAVQWESPASDGGVGIDNYTLTGAGVTVPLTVLSNEPLMATLTRSYNEMHMVSITASNCAGESTATVVTIHEVGCGPLTPPLNGSLLNLTSSQEGVVVAFGCSPGLVPSQQRTSVCAANESWTPDPAELVCREPADCGDPSLPMNGFVMAYGSTLEGTEIVFQCSPGFAPSQQRMSVCMADGRWSPDPAGLVCMLPPPGDCGVPASPTDGTVAYTTTTEGSQATFQCSAGLVPGEVMTAVCEESGGGARWSPNPGDLSCATPSPTTTAPPEASSNQAVVIAVVVVVVIAVSVAVVATVIIVYLCWRRRKSSGAFVVKTEAAADVSYDYARVTGPGVEMDSLAKDANGFYDQPDTQKPATERLENATDGFYSYVDTRHLPPPQKTERSHYADLGLSSSHIPPPVPSDAVHYSQITSQPATAKKPPRKPINIVHPADKLLNLDTVLAQLVEVQESWYELGTGLGVPGPTLDDIRSQCTSSQECMIETIDSWIRGHTETPTWKTITAVLQQINFQSLAASIDQVYTTGELPTPFDNSVPSSSLGIPSNFGSPGGLGTPEDPPPPIPARMNTLEATPPPKPPRDRGEREEAPPLPARLEPEGVAPPRPPKSPLSGPPRPARRSRRRTPERNIEMPSRPPKPAPYRGDQ